MFNSKRANTDLPCSETYEQCQTLLFNREIKTKISIVVGQKKDFEHVKNILREKGHTCEFVHISCHFLVGNDSKLGSFKNVYYKTLRSLGFKNNELANNPEEVI